MGVSDTDGVQLVQQASSYYDEGKTEELFELVEALWPADLDGELPAGIAEACRYARILAWKRYRETDEIAYFTRFQVLSARALTAAVINRARDTAAGLVLAPFFALTEENQHEEAREVLRETMRLVQPDHPRRNLFERMYHEKTAYSYSVEGQFQTARDHYQSALGFCDEDLRGALKVRGGAAISGYLALQESAGPHGDAQEPIAEMRSVAGAAQSQGFPDVAEVAERNLELMERAEFEGWHAFEVL